MDISFAKNSICDNQKSRFYILIRWRCNETKKGRG